MGASIQRLRQFVSRWPFLSFVDARAPVSGRSEIPGGVALDRVAVLFTECEGVCEPTAEQIEAQERAHGPIQGRPAPADHGIRGRITEPTVLKGGRDGQGSRRLRSWPLPTGYRLSPGAAVSFAALRR